MFNENVTTLNNLIATTLDSVDGYTKAADDATSERFAQLFRERAAERLQVADQLKAEVRRKGAEPEDDGTILAAAHRAFLGLRDAVTGTDDEAIVKEVERGEDHIKAKFEDALRDDDLEPQSRAVVQQCFTSVQQGHDQMSAIQSIMDRAD
ncbi:PA2169 family four-helix-bundle protein [Parasphingopyxis algicola]|uniref:ferritin-like domain-containing protein n=1 Tax=Parasphingopyxis algicola TaxID=2026624 RepID=UPI0015A364C9|nr:PA2169 family four-helix-bundle protein [Parasphingopyxis algicola]QLC25724.1 PA2169 family four-helix-bundle protein [Parasphingopyxis algicola]